MGYRDVSTPDLESRWESLRGEVAARGARPGDMAELMSLRREIDRRRGDNPPPVEIDFETYVTK